MVIDLGVIGVHLISCTCQQWSVLYAGHRPGCDGVHLISCTCQQWSVLYAGHRPGCDGVHLMAPHVNSGLFYMQVIDLGVMVCI